MEYNRDVTFKADAKVFRVQLAFNGNPCASCTTTAVLAYQIQRHFWEDICAPIGLTDPFSYDEGNRPNGLQGRVLTLDHILNRKTGEYDGWNYSDDTGNNWGCWVERIN